MIKYLGKSLVVSVGEEDLENLSAKQGLLQGKSVGELKILVIGDLHLGYEEVLNKSGVLVGRKLFEEMLFDLEEIFKVIEKGKMVNVKADEGEEVKDDKLVVDGGVGLGDNDEKRSAGKIVDKVILLGDIKHDFGEINRQEWSDTLKLFEFLEERCGELIVIKGNHDNMLQGIARQRDVVVRESYVFGEYCFMHGDKDILEAWGKNIKTWVIGHVHPAVKLSDGVKTEKYKCFLTGKFKGRKVIIVPSFSEYSSGSDFRESDLNCAWGFDVLKFEVGVVGEDLRVLDFGKLGKIE